MKTVSMSGSLRENVGKKDARKTRLEGKVPCVLYGGSEQLHFSIPEKDFKDIIFTPEVCFIDLNVDGKEFKASLKDVQYHPVTDNIYHVDFLEIIEGKTITMNIPLVVTGNSTGVLRGGKLIRKLRRIKVKGLPHLIPDNITLDITDLDIGGSIKVSSLKSEGIEFLDSKNIELVAVKMTRAVEEATPEVAKK